VDFTGNGDNSYGDVTIAGEGLQNLGLSSAFRVFEHGGIFIFNSTSDMQSNPKDRSIYVASCSKQVS
jgi:hypothetical protein